MDKSKFSFKAKRIGILGAGTWGTALARILSNCGNEVTIWSAISEEIESLSASRKHINLPGMLIPSSVNFTVSIEDVCLGKDVLIFAVPSVYIRVTARAAASFITNNQIIVSVAKGLEPDSLLTMTQVIQDELTSAGIKGHLVALSGPTHAEEVAKDMPTMIVSACNNLQTAKIIQDMFANSCMRVYTNPDLEGVELCGAVKNVIALAVGIAAGLGYGDNTKAALITRGMAEITRLGTSMGCFEQTFSGLSGIGDLVVTATSVHSRNYRCGYEIGNGLSPQEAVKKVGMVVEGINAIKATLQLAKKLDVTMPITEGINDIIYNHISPQDIVAALLKREQQPEISTNVNYEHTLLQNRRNSGMKRIITYGTYDLLHYGHINLLRRAKALGDYLIVVLSSDEFNWNEKHKKTYFTYEQRKQLLESIRYVDLVIPEENWQQKRSDMHEYHIDTFVMGDDWKGKFDFLKEEGVEVVYLPRTPEISSTQIKKDLYDAADVESNTRTSHEEINTDPD